MLCLNEAETLETFIAKTERSLREHRFAGEIIAELGGSAGHSRTEAPARSASSIRRVLCRPPLRRRSGS